MDEEEDSLSDGFSASEEEWKPGKGGGESSDDDDSDFEDSPVAGSSNVATTPTNATKKREPKSRITTKQASNAKKRKSIGQSLRSKLYNKYRPPPKTLTMPSVSNNSPSASTSRTASKNAIVPNESSEPHENNSSNESSGGDYLGNPEKHHFQSSIVNMDSEKVKEIPPTSVFGCQAVAANHSDSGSEDNNESSADEHSNTKAFDLRDLLDKTNRLECTKFTQPKHAPELKTKHGKSKTKIDMTAIDVNTLLALGEKQNHSSVHHQAIEEDFDRGPSKLNKTKSTRVKRHTKTRPTSTVVVAAETDDSDWENVPDGDNSDIDSSHPEIFTVTNFINLVQISCTRRHNVKDVCSALCLCLNSPSVILIT